MGKETTEQRKKRVHLPFLIFLCYPSCLTSFSFLSSSPPAKNTEKEKGIYRTGSFLFSPCLQVSFPSFDCLCVFLHSPKVSREKKQEEKDCFIFLCRIVCYFPFFGLFSFILLLRKVKTNEIRRFMYPSFFWLHNIICFPFSYIFFFSSPQEEIS